MVFSHGAECKAGTAFGREADLRGCVGAAVEVLARVALQRRLQ